MADMPQNSLFRFRLPCRRLPANFNAAKLAPEALSTEFRVPIWSRRQRDYDGFGKSAGEAGPLEGRRPENEDFFDFRIGWSPDGLALTVVVANKKTQPSWTRSELSFADCLRLCLDTRDVKDAHRAGRFCHKFYFYPLVGESSDVARPFALWVPLNRAKALPNTVDVDDFSLASERRADGCAFSAFLPGASLTGYEPDEIDRLGIHFEYRDSEHGTFVLQFAEPFPVEDDPSLWATLELSGASER